MNELSFSKKYPAEQFNLLGNTDVMVEIPDIKTPVIQAIRLESDPAKGDVYIQQYAKKEWTDEKHRKHPATPNLYAITKNGLKKLADGAGITMISSQHVIPTTCQKCVAVNQHSGKVVQCGNCKNRDVAYHVTICVPQLTGKDITVEDTHEIIVDNVTSGMTDKQKAEFMKHLPQICEAKALNGAIRTALHIKGTYTLKTMGLLVITDAMLNRVTENWKKGKRTHIFLDEFHVVFGNEHSGTFFNSAWRRFRKRNAFPTAITQNVEYLLDSVLASTMLSNSEYIVMLNQAASDRQKLAELLNISNEQMSYITNADAGCGLIKYGSSLVPFVNKFPKDTRLYKLMTTKPGEDYANRSRM